MKPAETKVIITKEQWKLIKDTQLAIRHLKIDEEVIVCGRKWKRLSQLKWSYDKPLQQDLLREIAN